MATLLDKTKAEVKRLEAENAKLKAALRTVRDYYDSACGCCSSEKVSENENVRAAYPDIIKE